MPCRRCAELLQDGDRFCRVCGEAQWDGADAAGMRLDVAGERKALAVIAGPAAAAIDRPGRRARYWPARRGAGGRQSAADVAQSWAPAPREPGTMVLGTAVVVLLLFGGVLVHDLYAEHRREADRLQQLSVTLDRMQQSLDRGELGAVEDALGRLDDDASADPRIQALRHSVERQRQRPATEPAPDPAQALAQPMSSPQAAAAAAAAVPAPAPAPAPVPPQPTDATRFAGGEPARHEPAAVPVADAALPSPSGEPVVALPAPAASTAAESRPPEAPVAATAPEPPPPPEPVAPPAAAPSAAVAPPPAAVSVPATGPAPPVDAPSNVPAGCNAALAAMALCPTS